MKLVHMGFSSDRRARCGARALLKTPDPARVTCRACVRTLAGEVTLAQLLSAAVVMWAQQTTHEHALEIVRGQAPNPRYAEIASVLEEHYMKGDRGEGPARTCVESMSEVLP